MANVAAEAVRRAATEVQCEEREQHDQRERNERTARIACETTAEGVQRQLEEFRFGRCSHINNGRGGYLWCRYCRDIWHIVEDLKDEVCAES